MTKPMPAKIDLRPANVRRENQAKRLGDTVKMMFMMEKGATLSEMAEATDRHERTIRRYLDAIRATGIDYQRVDGNYTLSQPLAETFKAT